MPLYNPNIGLISHIQKYSTNDGPGIRNTVFLKGCPLGCLWCSNPELIRPEPDLLYRQDLCNSCDICIDVCPREALSYDEDNNILINRSICSACGDCVDACPENALEIIGKEITVKDLMDELLKDAVFYQTSEGGVTFSGGEPLYQSGFIKQVAQQLKREGIHTAIDTAGEIPWCRIEEVLDVTDLMLFDIKTIDSDKHQRLTGRDNELILANAKMLSAQGIPMHIRLVVVPGMNDDLNDLNARMEFISELKSVKQIDLLPYHRYGVGKYDRLGLEYTLSDLMEHTEDQIEAICAQITTYGIPVKVGG